MANLSDLSSDMVLIIAKRLKKLEDFVSFSCVSRSLRSIVKIEHFEGIRLRQHTPYLMLPVRDCNVDNDVREFYSLVEGEETVASVKVPNFKTKKCLESLGWLLATEKDGSMTLLEPFSGTVIPLPHQNTFPEYEESYGMDEYVFFQKMVLSSRPTESCDFVLMVICGGHGHLGFWRLGDKSWNIIETRIGAYTDVVYHGGGQFYAIGYPGIVWMFDFAGINQDNYNIQGHISTYFMFENLIPHYESGLMNVLVDSKNLYILKCSIGDSSLLIITRTTRNLSNDGLSRITSKFQVYQVDLTTSTWKEIYDLGNMSVFLGHNSTTIVDASKFHGVIKGNRIYFTDDDWEFYYFYGSQGGGMDIGVFNFETGTIEPIYGGNLLLSKVSPSTWITPCL